MTRSGTREFTAEKTRAQNPVFFLGKVAVRGRRWRVSVSAVSRVSIRKVVDKMCTRLVARARFHTKIAINTDGLGPLFENDVDKMCTRLQRELDFTLKS